jgi:C4-dicarboxylate-specific signal transduction histidine kinase
MSASEAAFMGRMTARMTHEMRNILAILKESAGLMTDILSLEEGGARPHRDKLERALSRIHDQIPRGVALLDHFNRLAHSMDQPRTQLEIGEFLEHIAAITRCFTRLKMVELKTSPAAESISIMTDPFRLHWILFSCIEHVLRLVPERGAIVLRAIGGEKGPHIEIRSEDLDQDACEMRPFTPPDLAHLEVSLGYLDAHLYTSVEPNEGLLLLKLMA